MDTIRFEVDRTDTPAWGPIDTVDIFVNGRSLLDLVREVELPFATRDGRPDRAGSYVGLPAEAIFMPSRRLLGVPDDRYDDWEGRISVLGCGVVGCWPLHARITVQDDAVVWDDFEQPHRRRWRHDRLGPFVFEREEYEAALRGAPDLRDES
ncbi:hypothetical protein GBA63_06555 [Rubrobacter tropicus]|uniref:Uncharacterized protein n=1 Tax=Rubrobacter tropicus TaxID=2653851 RepID=A0A6G8Q7B5_9ACTN|nr:hypothetical protein [Rubrobacter tropicus]QIN82350.1 hypothetical protein GBA63_06555 [Rubrobacter tropicus]